MSVPPEISMLTKHLAFTLSLRSPVLRFCLVSGSRYFFSASLPISVDYLWTRRYFPHLSYSCSTNCIDTVEVGLAKASRRLDMVASVLAVADAGGVGVSPDVAGRARPSARHRKPRAGGAGTAAADLRRPEASVDGIAARRICDPNCIRIRKSAIAADS